MNFLRRPAHALLGDVFASETNVAFNRATEQKHFLKHDRKVLSQRFQVPIAQIDAIEQNPPALNVVETHQQIRDRRLA